MKTRTVIIAFALLTGLGYLARQHQSRAASRILPFQGQLKDAQGNTIADGPKLIQFKLYDAPVGGKSAWNGEVQRLSINGGLASTLLGTKANLSDVDFNQDLYLELTVDANDDGQITAADPPLLPRQSVLPYSPSKLPTAANSLGMTGVHCLGQIARPARFRDPSCQTAPSARQSWVLACHLPIYRMVHWQRRNLLRARRSRTL